MVVVIVVCCFLHSVSINSHIYLYLCIYFILNYFAICRFIITQMKPYVHDDYVIVYFHQGLNEANKPSIQFLWNSYKELDRNFRKNLKRLYVVHPTWTIRVIWNFFKPFISEKFKNKLVYISSLEQLAPALGLNHLKLPDNIKE